MQLTIESDTGNLSLNIGLKNMFSSRKSPRINLSGSKDIILCNRIAIKQACFVNVLIDRKDMSLCFIFYYFFNKQNNIKLWLNKKRLALQILQI